MPHVKNLLFYFLPPEGEKKCPEDFRFQTTYHPNNHLQFPYLIEISKQSEVIELGWNGGKVVFAAVRGTSLCALGRDLSTNQRSFRLWSLVNSPAGRDLGVHASLTFICRFRWYQSSPELITEQPQSNNLARVGIPWTIHCRRSSLSQSPGPGAVEWFLWWRSLHFTM